MPIGEAPGGYAEAPGGYADGGGGSADGGTLWPADAGA